MNADSLFRNAITSRKSVFGVVLISSIALLASSERLSAGCGGCIEPEGAQNAEKPLAQAADKPATTKQESQKRTEKQPAPKDEKDKPIALFDGKSLKGWEITKFGGEGGVSVKDGQLILEMGNDMTGVTTTRKDLLKSNYEVTLEAMRLRGSDFFCGMTFPVKDGFLTLILGGWGGGLCGLSSIGGYDASENETSSNREFKDNTWYKVRLRVTDTQIDAWIDDEKIISHTIDSRKLDVRLEVEISKPFGFSTWRTAGALRKIEMRKLTAEEAAPMPDPQKGKLPPR